MSHIRCPLCGKDSAVSTFNPEDLDRDIYIRQASGLGYPGGFTYGPDESVLGDDEYTPKIIDRCIDLLNMCKEKEIITARELTVRLKIGVPIQGTNEVVPYDDAFQSFSKHNERLREQVSSLKSQLSTRIGDVSRSRYVGLETKYDKLINDLKIKREIENILKFLHNMLDSKIVLEEDDWVLEVYEYNPSIFRYLCKIMYTLNRKERDMLENRVKTECVEFKRIFWIFKGEPTITSKIERWIKKPGRFYYALHNLPFPLYLKDKGSGVHQDFNWETFSQ